MVSRYRSTAMSSKPTFIAVSLRPEPLGTPVVTHSLTSFRQHCNNGTDAGTGILICSGCLGRVDRFMFLLNILVFGCFNDGQPFFLFWYNCPQLFITIGLG